MDSILEKFENLSLSNQLLKKVDPPKFNEEREFCIFEIWEEKKKIVIGTTKEFPYGFSIAVQKPDSPNITEGEVYIAKISSGHPAEVVVFGQSLPRFFFVEKSEWKILIDFPSLPFPSPPKAIKSAI